MLLPVSSSRFGADSFSPATRIALSVALIGVSLLLVGRDVYVLARGAHVVAQVSEVEVLPHHGRSGGGVRTHLRFRAPDGPMTVCQVGDIHAREGQMVPIRFLPPSECAVAGDWRGIAGWSVFAWVGVAGIVWTLSRRSASSA